MELIEWLLQSDPYVEYNTRVKLLGQLESTLEVQLAKKKMLEDHRVKILLSELKEWPGYALKRHNDAKHLIHKLAFITDIGIKKTNPTLEFVSNRIFTQQSDEGTFQIIVNIPTHFGGSGEDELLWMLCDTPIILYSILQMGWSDDKRVKQCIDYLKGLIRENGWPCVSSPKLGGKFKGPGRRSDPCPYTNLIMLKAFTQKQELANSKESKLGIETILSLWDQRKQIKPYLFGMGTDFKKLKAPLIWYDVLHVADVLSNFNWLHKDERLLEMVDIISEKANPDGFYTAESVWRAYKEWDFGQKREPSPWITLLVYRILKRLKKFP
ncbi:MAG: hypothetical protein FK732_01675 [Asgard group archaeon]|nr:hypothetical protein [Asgard group archaeon]